MRDIEKAIFIVKEIGGSGTITEITSKYDAVYPNDFTPGATLEDKISFVRNIIAFHCIGFDEYQQNRHNTAYFKYDSDNQIISFIFAMFNADC